MTDAVERAEVVLENRVHVLADLRSMALIKELTDEVKRLRKWKDEALEVIAGLQDLGRVLDMPLGARVTGEAAAEKAKALREERDRLAEKIKWVTQLAVHLDVKHSQAGLPLSTSPGAAIRAVLDDPQSGDPCSKQYPEVGHEDEGYSCSTHNMPWGECQSGDPS